MNKFFTSIIRAPFALIIVALLNLLCLPAVGQSQSVGNEAPSYQVKGLVIMTAYNLATGPGKLQKQLAANLSFEVSDPSKTWNEQEYVIVRVYPISPSVNVNGVTTVDPLKGSVTHINSDDNPYLWCLTQKDFTRYLTNKLIISKHVLGYVGFDYGAKVSLPFKLRFRTQDEKNGNKLENVRITPDITLGGYIGPQFRISSTKEHFLTLPVFTAGLTTLMLNDNTLKGSTTANGNPQEDGFVLGVTGSMGAVVNLESFQIGTMVGWDYAAGDIGADWLYNGKPWVSFSIGYAFLSKDK